MDANGSRFFSVSERAQYQLPPGVEYVAVAGCLRLASQPAGTPTLGTEGWMLEYTSVCSDGMGSHAYSYYGAGGSTSFSGVMATSSGQPPVPLLELAASEGPAPHNGRYIHDLAVSCDGVLYIAERDTRCIVLHDLRGRFPRVWLPLGESVPYRLAADPRGGVWALGSASMAGAQPGVWLYRVTGLPRPPSAPYNADVLRPVEESPEPLRCTLVARLPSPLHEQLTAIDLACSAGGRLVVLAHDPSNRCCLLQLSPDRTWLAPMLLRTEPAHYVQFLSVAWIDEERVALQCKSHGEVISYVVPAGDAGLKPQPPLPAAGDYFPMPAPSRGRFVRTPGGSPQYWSADGSLTTSKGPSIHPLVRIPFPSYLAHAVVPVVRPLDSGASLSTWHRLYLEASVPAGCGLVMFLAATDTDDVPSDDDYHPHCVGSVPDSAVPGERSLYPHAVRQDRPSELPFHPGVIPRDRATAAAETGLFAVLIQRARCPVRALRGRYLWIRIALFGSGCNTPELYALRAYAPRFSYRDRYLPELYWETQEAARACAAPLPEAMGSGPVTSTPADFLERFLCLFESILTPLEDQVAHAHLLATPARVPAEGLTWLASFIGFSLDRGLPIGDGTRRRLLARAPDLYRLHGTLAGLQLALDVVTDGAVTRGDILVVEHFRIRRTFATILGIPLKQDDELTQQSLQNANSVVGDTLFLGDSQSTSREELCALFRLDPSSAADPYSDPDSALRAVRAFYSRHAHRVTILVSTQVDRELRSILGNLIARLIPAAVEPNVVTTTQRFLVGVAALLGVDTVPGGDTATQPLRLNATYLGQQKTLQGGARLDPRLVRVGMADTETTATAAIRTERSPTTLNGAGS